MSYNLTILKDSPISFLKLDEYVLSGQSNLDYSDSNIQYNNSLVFYNSQDSSTTLADYSGCSNIGATLGSLLFSNNRLARGLYYGSYASQVIGNTSSISLPINNDFYATNSKGGMATADYSDNDFTLETWFKSNISSNSETKILADSDSNIGLYYKNGSIIFKLENESIFYKLEQPNKSMLISATYNINSMSLYVDGNIVASRQLTNFKFTNTSLSFSIGPTLNSQDYFLIDGIAIYRYALSNLQIATHYLAGLPSIEPIQIVQPDNGILFNISDENINPVYKYEYVLDSQWSRFVTEDTYYDQQNKYITFYQTATAQAKTLVINDILNIPSGITINNSKVEWLINQNIVVEFSTNGTTWTAVENGGSVPGYSGYSSISTTPFIFIRITMSTADASKDLPRLSKFKISFYSNKEISARNYGYKITTEDDYQLGSFSYPVFLRHPNSGLKTKTKGFDIEVSEDIKSIEFFYNPLEDNSSATLISCASNSTELSWASGGVLTATNISGLYIDGVIRGDYLSLQNYLNTISEPAHICVVFTQPITGNIKFNYKTSSLTYPSAQYQNIALYREELSLEKAQEHILLYTGNTSGSSLISTPSNSSFSVTELTPQYYNYDYLVVSNI